MSTYMSYQLGGKKEEFANWVSDISPEYTPFISMLAKFPVKNTHFQWQTDILKAVDYNNHYAEGSNADAVALTATEVKSNYTQIMRKVVMVSDTANAVSAHGREKELFYQLKKAAKELKRDHEAIFLLKDQAAVAGSGSAVAKTASLGTLIDTSMKKEVTDMTKFEAELFLMMENLYTEGAEANIIMYHPKLAKYFAELQERVVGTGGDAVATRQRIFENDKRFVKEVNTIIDPLGQEFKCVPNRWCPKTGADMYTAYLFNPKDVAMAVLRAPSQEKLGKAGSAEKYMIEQEVGLRLNNPKAAAMLTFKIAG